MITDRSNTDRLGWIVIIIAVVFVAQGLFLQVRAQQFIQCNAEVNNAFRAQIIDARQVNNEAREQLMILFATVRDTTDKEKINEAIDNYLKIAQAQQAKAKQTATHDQFRRC